jgi:nicotinate phosphoribosyltransferase
MRDFALLTDYYELTMGQGYFSSGALGKYAVFDLFFRENPCGGGYTIAAGLSQAADYIENLAFSGEEISYLRSLGAFTPEYLSYLKNFRFTGDIYAVPEGTAIFPREPILRVSAPIAEAQIIETALLNCVNHQSLIATKASRVCLAAGGDPVLEFGLRRAQGPDAGIYGSRAAMIGGCAGTSNTLAGMMFGVPVKGTIAHSWVMSFESELEAFRAYAERFPGACVLLADTYDTLKSGVPNAITVFSELRQKGADESSFAIRLDSGDISYLSKRARRMLDSAGFPNVGITASSDLDEHLIAALKQQGAKVSAWGVGTRLITSSDCPALGGVYKMSALSAGGGMQPKIKLSDNSAKVTDPGVKQVYRLCDKTTGRIRADLIALEDETIDASKDITVFDPRDTWKKTTLRGGEYTARPLLEPVFSGGKRVSKSPPVMEIRSACAAGLGTLWDEVKRLVNPQIYFVDLSERLYNLKADMITRLR